jgi:hypothetical protein
MFPMFPHLPMQQSTFDHLRESVPFAARYPRHHALSEWRERRVARIIERTAQNGAKSWLVKWRIGGGRNGKEDFETCYERQVAEDFAALVTLSGENRPHGYPKGCHGIQDPNFDGTADPDMPTFERYARHNYATRLGASPTQRACGCRLIIRSGQVACGCLFSAPSRGLSLPSMKSDFARK